MLLTSGMPGTTPAPTCLRIRGVEAIGLEERLAKPVDTPMSAIQSVVALLVVVVDDDGMEGWGEIWCNFPRFGIHHRARMLKEVFAPALVGCSFESPGDAWAKLTAMSNVLRLQAGESGPVAAVIAGIDIALHDLAAKRAGMPLWQMLGGKTDRVSVYASLGRAEDNRPGVVRAWDRGFRAFKVRSAGSIANHIAVVRPLRELIGPSCELMLDVNASWDPADALATIHELAPERLAWLEEPIPVDASPALWSALATAAPMPLAGGENMVTAPMFESALAGEALAVLQPDITKWGGFSGGLPLARRICAAGRRFCPHMFTAAPGVLASAHLLAAADSPDGVLEYGVTPNPLRDALLEGGPKEGVFTLPDAPGLGFAVDRSRLERFRIAV